MSQPGPLASSRVAQGKWGAPDLCFGAEPPGFAGWAIPSSVASGKGRQLLSVGSGEEGWQEKQAAVGQVTASLNASPTQPD